MPIHSISSQIIQDPNFFNQETSKIEGFGQAQGDSFSKHLEQSVTEVDKLLKEADSKIEASVSGGGESIHEAMIAFEKAETAMKLMMQVRNKAIDAYQRVMQMQV